MDIIEAVKTGDLDKVKKLLVLEKRFSLIKNISGIKPLEQKDENGETALFYAVKKYDLEMAELLLEAGAKVDAGNNVGSTPLHFAAFQSHDRMVALFIKNNADVNALDFDHETPLHFALSKKGLQNKVGALSVALLLVRAGANYFKKNGHGNTPLQGLRSVDNGETMKTLILEEAEKVPSKKDFLNILGAAAMGHLDVVKELIADGVNVDMTHSDYESTALHDALDNGNFEIADLLIDAGANIDSKGYMGFTSLHKAIISSLIKVAEFSLVSGANIEVTDNLGRRPLELIGISRYQDPKVSESINKILDAKAIVEKFKQGWQLTKKEASLECLDNLEGGPDMKRRFLKVHDSQHELLALQQKLGANTSREVSNRSQLKKPKEISPGSKRRKGFRP